MINDEKLIPDLVEYRKDNSNPFSIDDWTSIVGDIKLAIGYSFLFWPEFIEHNGCIFIKSHFAEDNFIAWTKADYVEHYGQIESVINHIHILDLFADFKKQEEITYEQIKFLGDKIREIYEVKLSYQYPDRKFIVNFNGDEELDDLLDYQLTFYQEKNTNKKIER